MFAGGYFFRFKYKSILRNTNFGEMTNFLTSGWNNDGYRFNDLKQEINKHAFVLSNYNFVLSNFI